MVKYYTTAASICAFAVLNCELHTDAAVRATFSRVNQTVKSDQSRVVDAALNKCVRLGGAAAFGCVRGLSLRCPVHSGQIQKAVPCNFDEGLCSCPPTSVEPQTAESSGCLECPAESIRTKKRDAS